MKRPALFLFAAVVLLAAATLWWWRFRREHPLLLSGTVESRDVGVGSLVGGRVASVEVEEGEEVTAGQLLVTLESDFVDIQIREQEAAVARTRAALERVTTGPRREELRRARIAWEDAERERRRLGALRAESVIGQQQYDSAAARADAAHETLEELTRGSRSEDVSESRAAVAQAEGRLDYLKRQRAEMEVRAPAAGRIEVLDLRPGDLVGAGQPFLTLLEPEELWVRVYVPETRLAGVRVGQGAAITVDGISGRIFSGRVTEIRSRGEYTPRNIQTLDQRNDQVFGVKVRFEPAPELKPGMAALVRLLPEVGPGELPPTAPSRAP